MCITSLYELFHHSCIYRASIVHLTLSSASLGEDYEDDMVMMMIMGLPLYDVGATINIQQRNSRNRPHRAARVLCQNNG